ncbi:MAG: hypothetical protein U0694_13355 [Anaerolineae bacterium]
MPCHQPVGQQPTCYERRYGDHHPHPSEQRHSVYHLHARNIGANGSTITLNPTTVTFTVSR